MQFFKHQIKIFSKILFSEFQESMGQSADSSKETTNPSLENLTPEQQELFKKIEGAEAAKQITGKASLHLKTQLKKIPNVGDDPEAVQTIQYYRSLMKKNSAATTELDDYQQQLGIKPKSEQISNTSNNGSKEIREISEQELKTITNREFLDLPDEERLQYVTKDNVDYENISNGNITEITFNFDQDGNGKDDTDLYMFTTAGQVLGKEVGEVESEGVIYTRGGLDGEFFNGNNRLVIHSDTLIKIPELRSPEDIVILEAGVTQKLEQYKESPNVDIVKEALERGIDPEFALLAYSEPLNNLNDGSRNTKIEELFTQFDRIKEDVSNWDGKTLENGKLPDDFVVMVLKHSNTNWKDKANEYGIDNITVDKVVSNLSEEFKGFDINDLPEGVDGLLDFISKAEGTNGNYEAIYGNGNQSEIKFTDMTLKEVLAYQKEYKKGKGSAAIGKYQFMDYTLEHLMTKHMISSDEKFTPQLQDKLAIFQLKTRGLDSYMGGSIDKNKFQYRLSKEWASLPKDSSNLSYYDGDNLNHALVSNKDIDGVLERLKDTA